MKVLSIGSKRVLLFLSRKSKQKELYHALKLGIYLRFVHGNGGLLLGEQFFRAAHVGTEDLGDDDGAVGL